MIRITALTLAIASVIVLMVVTEGSCGPKPFITTDHDEARKFERDCEGVSITNEEDGEYSLECKEKAGQ